MKSIGSRIWDIIEKIIYFCFIKVLHLKFLEKNWNGFIQFVKFGMVGLMNTIISYFSYLLFLWLHCHYIVASVLSFIISVTSAYICSSKFVFTSQDNSGEEVKKDPWWKVYFKTLTAYAFTGLLLANILLILWVQVIGISEAIAPLFNLVITVPLNFIINKFWAYRKA